MSVRRVSVVGNSGSGKSHLARRLAAALDVPCVELDALNHRAGWTQAPAHELRAELSAALAGHERTHGGWVVDGNYWSRIGDVVDPDTYVWLDYPRTLVLRRIVRRSVGRVLLRRTLWNGNRERWRSLLARDPLDNIVLWSWTQHDSYRIRYEQASAREPARWIRLQHPRDAENWLRKVSAAQ